ncbi:hypothetical protein F4782DRAFT_547436, partial [Xylaria castorea]
QVYREIHSACSHSGQIRVSDRCAIGKGTSCPNKTMGPVKTVAGKCATCQRKEQQAARLIGDSADLGALIAYKFRRSQFPTELVGLSSPFDAMVLHLLTSRRDFSSRLSPDTGDCSNNNPGLQT